MDMLFLLTPGFTDSARDGEGKKYYCPDCAFLEGVLPCCPELRTRLDIRYVAYPRPRRRSPRLRRGPRRASCGSRSRREGGVGCARGSWEVR